MTRIELLPDIDHCIETMARREFRDTARKLLSSDAANADLEEKAEILRLFLETADFKRLRAKSEPHLLRGETVRFSVYMEDGALKCRMFVAPHPKR
jgi:hypothetical protein